MGRGRGRGRGRGASASTTPKRQLANNSSSPTGALDVNGALSSETFNAAWVIRMEDLVERGAVAQLPGGRYQIDAGILEIGRSSITIGAAVGGDKRRFNLKWLYEYPWLRFEPNLNAMMCAMCKECKRANQFAKRGSRNFKTSALVDHSSSNDHQKSIAHLQYTPKDLLADDETGRNVALVFEDGMPDAAEAVSADTLDGSGANDRVVDRKMVAQPSASVDSYITADSITTIASRRTPTTEGVADESHHPSTSQHHSHHAHGRTLPPVPNAFAGSQTPGTSASATAATVDALSETGVHTIRKVSRETTNGSSGAQPDEKYAREFEHAVQALLQAMRLNLPISSVGELYRLQIQPTPLSDIGSSAASTNTNDSTELRLAGAYSNSAEAARTLQHVVSSEILSLVKDEVSQSPAFSVIIDEAPLREHNSLVAHVLLYLRYLRRDPTSERGLQVVTRFWRCMHLYHEYNGKLARRDATGLVIALLDRAKIDTSRLVCVSCERPVSREDEESERRRQPHVIHWHGLFTYANSLSPQVYEEITNRSDDFVRFAMTLMDLCLFMYSHPSRFAFLGIEFQEMLYKTLYEIFLGEGSLSTRLPISLTPSIVIAITRNISQIMATVVALAKTPGRVDAAAPGTGAIPDMGADVVGSTPRSPRQSLQIPLPVVDILVSSFGGLGSRKSVGRCPPADVLLTQLRDYSFLGCVHFMADILFQIKPVIDIASRSDMPTRALGKIAEPTSHTLDQRLRAYIGTVRDAIESITLMYGDDSGSTDEGGEVVSGEGADDEYHGFHLDEFMKLTDNSIKSSGGAECLFRTFAVANYHGATSQASLVELIRTVSSSILHDLHQRFCARDIATIQAMSDMWDPTQFPRTGAGARSFAEGAAEVLARHLSQNTAAHAESLQLTGVERSLSNMPLIDANAVADEWIEFKAEVHREAEDQLLRQHGRHAQSLQFSPGKIQLMYHDKLFPGGSLAPSRRRLRSVETTNEGTDTAHLSASAWSRFGNLAKLVTAWNVMPLALSTDLHHYRRLYERQLSRICREQAENKLQSINFDMGDSFSELLGRLALPQQQSKGRKVTVYDLLQNSKVEVETGYADSEKPVPGIELSGVTIEYFLRSIDAVTMALDHRLRLLSLDLNEAPLSVSSTPGACPRWLQNAMRGYWKLACRPPRSLNTRNAHGTRLRKHALSSATASIGTVGTGSAQTTNSVVGSGVLGSASTTSQMSDHMDANLSSAIASKQRSTASAPAAEFPNTSFSGIADNLQSLNMQSLSTFAEGSLATPSSILMSATAQPVGTNDISTLPLLEALLSGPNTAVPPPPGSAPASMAMASHINALRAQQQQQQHQHQHQSMMSGAAADDMALSMSTKRPYDARMPATASGAMGPSQPAMSIYGDIKPDGSTSMMANQLAMPPNKRMRPSDMQAADNGGVGSGYGFQQQHQHQHQQQYQPQYHQQRQQQQQQMVSSGAGSGQENELFGSAIVRLASDMGLDAVSTQALAASMSGQQSNQFMPHQQMQQRYAAQMAFASQAGVGIPHNLAASIAGPGTIPISATHSQQAMYQNNPHVGSTSLGQISDHDQQPAMNRQQQQQQAFDYRFQSYVPDQTK
ncbi:hypothetical protein LPJ53_005728 [Coemansia erecta]|uniref:TTF-type domain-containing protein n=1 Tax=Coemansia erecta TaxID=147472 RepID=A0A9W7XW11_9FUNG|nr:hypothetical protein LPJ53_005728 [Coemansia erecta]